MLTTESQERFWTWVEHFGEILNRDDPTNPVEEDEIKELEEIEETDEGIWGIQEVKEALRKKSQGKRLG